MLLLLLLRVIMADMRTLEVAILLTTSESALVGMRCTTSSSSITSASTKMHDDTLKLPLGSATCRRGAEVNSVGDVIRK